ncbi:MAG TPA: GSCFA domain protein [Prolixibacteraceae bacterium]|nr:GSCFA domain protein [Prolixibacteraceae bacterium]
MEPKFRTEVKIPEFRYKTGYAHQNMFLGSCFTENIGSRMAVLKYPVDINPFGILYNPESVANSLKMLLNGRKFSLTDLVHHEGLWHSFSHHGRFSSEDANVTLQQINERLEYSSAFLKTAGFLFITFGTARVYKHKKSGETVANCHKIPDSEFIRSRLTVDEIVAEYLRLIDEIRAVNPSIKIIFTVSPIRHWKDGAVENQLSKATLLLAIDEIIHSRGENCAYFPAYELVMDELRDYRFYAPDMLHISDVAIDFIWNKFENALIDAESRQISVRVQKIVQAANHRPFNKNTPEYSRFLLQMQEHINNLEKEFKNIDFTGEKVYFFGSEK